MIGAKTHMVIDNSRVSTLMQNNLDYIDCLSPTCIFTIPEYIRKGSEDAYWPIVISIGPVYYKDTKLEAMQESVDPTNVEHLLHLYWMCCLHNLNLRNPNRQDMSTDDHDALEISYLTLKDLQASGVKIIASESLQLPETMKPLLKNLLYFEQCYSFGLW
ncbi:unnamed protein product [Amaranthus hypochondriacus]